MNTDTLDAEQKKVWAEFLEDTCKYAGKSGRWPEAEEFIIKDPKWAYCYAKNVIKGRWPEAEETIRKDPEWAMYYALYFIDRELATVRASLSELDWTDPANDFPLPQRIKDALKKVCLAK